MAFTLSFHPSEEELGSRHIQESAYDRILVNEPLPDGILGLQAYDVSTFTTREEFSRYTLEIMTFLARKQAQARIERRVRPFTRSHEHMARQYEREAYLLLSYLDDIQELAERVKKPTQTWYDMIMSYFK
jgi:hypothetical protein